MLASYEYYILEWANIQEKPCNIYKLATQLFPRKNKVHWLQGPFWLFLRATAHVSCSFTWWVPQPWQGFVSMAGIRLIADGFL